MKRMVSVSGVLVFLFMVVAGCASKEAKPVEGLGTPSQEMTKNPYTAGMRWLKPGVDFKKYTKFMFEPVVIYRGEDADFGKISEEDKEKMATFMGEEFPKIIGEKYPVVKTPGPDVARVKLTLAGLSETVPGVSTVAGVFPIGLVMNIGKSAAGYQGTLVGSATIAVEIYDSETNVLLAAFLQKRFPLALDVTKTFSTFKAAETAITESAETMRNGIDRIQAGGTAE
jgi:hypothetical protein